MSITKNRDFEQLKSKIPTMMFLQKFLPDGKKTGNEWVSVNPTRNDNKAGSFKINIATTIWCDFATNDKGGDLISLYAYLNGCTQIKAFDDLSQIYFNAKPATISKQSVKTLKRYNSMDEFPEQEGLWSYYDYDGKFLGYVIRLKKKDAKGNKIFMPFIEDGSDHWISTWWPCEFKPIYRASQLKIHPDKPVLICEGEKATDAAQLLFPDFVCITWMGGSNNAHKADITHLANRTCFLWPDNDLPGINAMHVLDNRLKSIVKISKVIDISNLGLLPKWDFARYDAIENDINLIQSLLVMPEKKNDIINIYDFPDLSKLSKPLNTSENIQYLLGYYNISIRYNLMTNHPEFTAINRSYSTVNEAECYLTEISNLCVRNSVPKVDLCQHVLYIADKNSYHPAIEFIESKPWDGTSRVTELLNTVHSSAQNYANKIIFRWLISCIAVVYAEKGLSLEGVLVFQGRGKVGKTYWFKKLLPQSHWHLLKDSMALDPNNKDSVMECTTYWLGELGELDGIIKKSEVEAQKQFITRTVDEYRVPFGKRSRKVPRRTAYFGSVNPTYFLEDPTGNRRYWTVAVNKIDYDHTIDMQQVWAELKILYENGESYRLTDDEQDLIHHHNLSHTPVEPLKESIMNRYKWNDELRNNSLTAKEVLLELNYSEEFIASKPGICKKCANILSELTGSKSRQSNGKSLFDLPPPSKIQEY